MGDLAELRKEEGWLASRAVETFLAEGFEDGDLIPHLFFMQICEVPSRDTTESAILYMERMEAVRDILLVEHKLLLGSVRGKGYMVVPATEQTAYAEGEMFRDIKRAIAKGHKRLINIDETKLDARQRKENDDALARVSQLETMTKRIAKA